MFLNKKKIKNRKIQPDPRVRIDMNQRMRTALLLVCNLGNRWVLVVTVEDGTEQITVK